MVCIEYERNLQGLSFLHAMLFSNQLNPLHAESHACTSKRGTWLPSGTPALSRCELRFVVGNVANLLILVYSSPPPLILVFRAADLVYWGSCEGGGSYLLSVQKEH